jgi:hypothetical protein
VCADNLLLATLFETYTFLKKLFADSGYQGPEFQRACTRILPRLETNIINRSDQAKGFVVLPRRWAVELTSAPLNRWRRLAKNWENLNHKAWAFLRSHQSTSCLPAGINSSTSFHSPSVKSLGYRTLLRSLRPRFLLVHIGAPRVRPPHLNHNRFI